MRFLAPLFFLLLSIAVSVAQYGPSGSTSPSYGTTAASETRQSTEARGKASESYTIGPMDGLTFRIIGEQETLTEVRVAADGTVNLPYVGSVKLAGKTVSQARAHLFELYDRDWYVNPQIDLLVVSYSQRRVQVLGKVARQGPVIFPPEEEMTLLTAIAYAGGWSPDGLARTTAVKLKRNEDGAAREFTIDTTSIGPKDWILKDGDIIEVPERRF